MNQMITYSVRDRNGVSHVRASRARTYTHCVIARPSYSREAQAVFEIRERALRRFADLHQRATATLTPAELRERRSDPRSKRPSMTTAELREWSIRQLGGATTAEAYAEIERHRYLDMLARRKAEGYYNLFQALCWCSSLDLAEKQASRAKYGLDEVTILPASSTGTPPRPRLRLVRPQAKVKTAANVAGKGV